MTGLHDVGAAAAHVAAPPDPEVDDAVHQHVGVVAVRLGRDLEAERVAVEAHGGVEVVDDLDTTFEKVRASGAEVLQEPASQPWGARDCAFRDPSGNLVRIAQA